MQSFSFDERGTRRLIDDPGSSDSTFPYDFVNDNNISVSTSSDHPKPARRLTLVDSIAILVGIIIGSGIFSSPGLALDRAGSPGLVLISWSLSGILVTLAAQCYLELGAMMPSAGGDFDYLKRAYGEQAAFSFAWYNFFVGKTGSQAIIATIFGRYFQSVIKGDTSSLLSDDTSADEDTITTKLLGVGLITIITIINCAGIKESAVVSIVLTSIKVLLVIMVFIFAIVYASHSNSNSRTISYNLSASSSFNGSNDFFSFATSMIACLWCFDGFADGNFLQEEMINPIRDLPWMICFGLGLVTCCYLLINIGYLSVLDKSTIIDSSAIAVQFGTTVSDSLFSSSSALPIILALGVSLSTMGSINGSIMTGGAPYAVCIHVSPCFMCICFIHFYK